MARTDEGRTANEVYEALQSAIVAGRIPPGAVLPQAEVARALQVSRTPVREAMLMLREAGLLVAEPNQRTRVLALDPAGVETVYIKLVALAAAAVAITAADISASLARKLYAALEVLDETCGQQDAAGFLSQSGLVVGLMVSGAGEGLAAEIDSLRARAVRHQLFVKGPERLPSWMERTTRDYRRTVDAMCAQEPHQAACRMARHIGEAAQSLLDALAPGYDPARLASALAFATFGADLPPSWPDGAAAETRLSQGVGQGAVRSFRLF